MRLLWNKSAARDTSWRDVKANAFQRFDGNLQWWFLSSINRFMSSFGFLQLISAFSTIKTENRARQLRSCSSRALNEDKNNASRLTTGWTSLQAAECGGFSTRTEHALSVEATLSGRSRLHRATEASASAHTGFCFKALPVVSWRVLSGVSVLIVPAATWLRWV